MAGLALFFDLRTVATIFEILLVVAFVALLLGRVCLGAYVYHVLRGHTAFANSTLPWAQGRTASGER
jgi:hypothetical protein